MDPPAPNVTQVLPRASTSFDQLELQTPESYITNHQLYILQNANTEFSTDNVTQLTSHYGSTVEDLNELAALLTS